MNEGDEQMPELELIETGTSRTPLEVEKKCILPKTGLIIASVSVKTPTRKRPLETKDDKEDEQPCLTDSFNGVCPCKIEQRINYAPNTLCRGAEFVDGLIKICDHKATGKKAFRSSHFVSFFIPLCQQCTVEMNNHHFCPACGCRCNLSTYIQCSLGHRFHTDCAELLSDGVSKCPHCSEDLKGGETADVTDGPKRWSITDRNVHLPRSIGTISNWFRFSMEENNLFCKMVNTLKTALESSSPPQLDTTVSSADFASAIESDDFSTISAAIISDNVTVRINGCTLFHHAVKKNKLYMAEIFHRFGVDASQGHVTSNTNALVDAVRMNCLRTVQYCLISGCDPCIKDMTGKSALHYAAKGADQEIVELLLEKCNRITMGNQDYSGFSVIQWAIEGNSLPILKLILRFATTVDLLSCDQEAKTALHWAAHYGKSEYCAELLQIDAKLIDLQDASGKTAMHYAAMSNSQPTIIVLAKYTPNLTLKDRTFKLPHDYTKVMVKYTPIYNFKIEI